MGLCRGYGPGARRRTEGAGRWLEVKKHRFGASVSGRHELDLRGWTHPAVYPEPHAWAVRHVHDVLTAHGWKFRDGGGAPLLAFHASLFDPAAKQQPIDGAFVLVTSTDGGFARMLSARLLPAGADHGSDLLLELDPLVLREEDKSGEALDVRYVPTVHGPARALRAFIERFAQVFEQGASVPRARRVLMGDLGLVLDVPESLAWVEVVRVFASLVIETGCGVPVIAHATVAQGVPGETSARSILASYPDARVEMTGYQARIGERWQPPQRDVHFPYLTDAKALPMALLHPPRPQGR